MGYEIKIFDNPEQIRDFNNSNNNVLLIGPVDKTLDMSTYQCFYAQNGGGISNTIGTLVVVGEILRIYACIYVCI